MFFHFLKHSQFVDSNGITFIFLNGLNKKTPILQLEFIEKRSKLTIQ
jgi:hypothetical protein